ncbi:PglD-related sugar-binding protein [Pseudarthrobacter niigatensis]|uniref:Sugar O-acyltransferase (Sialic acid O-acetyltransferase NeuD family) n=1 Tax=Pseudarthrobacter niigatensis TaxID=369935 RepID=A0AAJ1WGV7_9MICC|nr:acetyltransferase [Pseudarthrobacter niigatensis]MDQ0145903.1 sugar O-acyltransferase (sialic acid O-acetyltransferase NeuD family) [Pseudarthrobacter niigatensis]MDQ0266369.1 sugar O-acyltransferase (sialic acid O-acetyltransferase NeuD family) [Pseudarthrobacter niigatensis]
MSELMLLGMGGLAREVLAAVRTSGQYDVLGILDDDPELLGTTIEGTVVMGALADAPAFTKAFFSVCLPSGRDREGLVGRLSLLGVHEDRYATVVDPDVRVPRDSRIGPGSIVMRNATISPQARIGRHVLLKPHVNVGCCAQVGDFATLHPRVSVGEGTRIGRAAHLGMNAGIGDGLVVGDYSYVGMRSAVTHNVPEHETWAGVPARAEAASNENPDYGPLRGRHGDATL